MTGQGLVLRSLVVSGLSFLFKDSSRPSLEQESIIYSRVYAVYGWSRLVLIIQGLVLRASH